MPLLLLTVLMAGIAPLMEVLSAAPTSAAPREPLGSVMEMVGSVDTLTANQRRRVTRLLDDRIACLGCHTLDGRGGTIGPALDDVGLRLSASRIRSMITAPQATLPGSVMPAQPLAPGDVDLLTELLADEGWSGSEQPTAPGDPAPSAESSAPELYQRHCASCHGATGAGEGRNASNLPVAPTDHTDAAAMSRRADDTLYDAIHAGGWVLDRSPRMPAFGALLTPAQIRSLVGYIRELCECSGPSWSNPGHTPDSQPAPPHGR